MQMLVGKTRKEKSTEIIHLIAFFGHALAVLPAL